MEDKNMNEQESLSIITEMIQKAKGSFNENGSSAILWGTVTAICGLVSFAQLQWHFSIGFDVWLLIFAAVIPQIIIVIQEKKKRIVKTYQESATDSVWIVYAISIGAVMLYQNIVPGVADKLMQQEGLQLLQRNNVSGELNEMKWYIPGIASIYLIIYAFPTIATGLINRYKPMIVGALFCYTFFIISLYTTVKYDMLLLGLAGLANWLIPGILLRQKFKSYKAS